ncbi:class I SAM-dependent methyltransferase [Pusillimonas sp. ANT_WB101]|uniref:class I SAM-dependent methyltransferase n=1 Tax=Pusillimonas sp. ANT_WB101 TaxID=2597356 RepID=UPI0011ED9A16|nr:class I SAM-dependent methyltransferase [Pusillimonas sp. ANT_WB101]KAA0911485.1 class I SAM-dependent methyltransferase [Pusillimonas sp. ANT_WB101]
MFRDLIDDLDDYSVEPDMLLDVPFVPTDEAVIEAMLNLGEVGPADLLYDLGSGDGRILVAAARDRDTRGIGVEIDPLRIADAFDYAAHTRVEYLVDFVEDSIFTADISDATVVTLYLLDSINVQLRPRLLRELRPGTRIISHAFDMGDWKADERVEFSGTKIYKWIVPAQVAGVWEWNGYDGTPYRVELQQKYQEVTGRAWVADAVAELKNATLCGASLELAIQEGGATSPTTFTLSFENNDLQSIVENA